MEPTEKMYKTQYHFSHIDGTASTQTLGKDESPYSANDIVKILASPLHQDHAIHTARRHRRLIGHQHRLSLAASTG